jgi:hypothetical protein
VYNFVSIQWVSPVRGIAENLIKKKFIKRIRFLGDMRLNEKRIQQVLEIEKQANEIREGMIQEASQLPGQAEKEAQAMLDQSRENAEREARAIIAKAQSEQETETILATVRERIQRTDSLAQGNFTHAVTYVIARVVGRG